MKACIKKVFANKKNNLIRKYVKTKRFLNRHLKYILN